MKDMAMPKMDKMKPSMRMESDDVKNLNDFQPGDKMEMKMMGKMMSKEMMKDGKCSAMIEMDNIEMTDEDSEKAGKMGMGRKDYKALMKKRAENKEKMNNENS